MTSVFPPLATASSSDAPAGAILRSPRSDGYIAIATDERHDETSRSLVILNANFRGGPKVVFADRWRSENCLVYKSNVRFELSMRATHVDPKGNEWWEQPGVLILIKDQFYIRAGALDRFAGENRLVNIETGSVFNGHMPSGSWTFGAWELWIKESPDKGIKLLDFDVAAKSKV